jgi:hypothetical protein
VLSLFYEVPLRRYGSWRCHWIDVTNHNGALSFWQVEKNFLNGKLKAITAYFEEQDSIVDAQH